MLRYYQKDIELSEIVASLVIRFIEKYMEQICFDNYLEKSGCYCFSQTKGPKRSSYLKLMPLRSIHYEIEVLQGMAEVTLLQTYFNPSEKFLQVQYSFPVSPNSCIYKFVAIFGATRIQGVVKEKEQAKKQYKNAVSQGRRVAYGQVEANSKDVMNLLIGNVPPQTEIRIEISYIEELTLSLNTFYRFQLPVKLTPKFTSQIPKQSIIAGFRREATDLSVNFRWDFTIRVKSLRKVISHSSLTHQLLLKKQNDSATELEWTLAEASLPSKDFVFIFTTEDFQLPSYTLGRDDRSSTLMVSFIPKFCSLAVEDARAAALASIEPEADLDAARGEYIFLLDRSGSMSGSRIQNAKQALILFVQSLPVDSYFNVVSFGSKSSNLFPSSQRYGSQSIGQALGKIRLMDASMGGTQIEKPLRQILKGPSFDGYPKQIFLLTDGEVDNPDQVLQLVKQNTRYARVHTIGIGSGISETLIIGCAEKGKGRSTFIYDKENPSEKIIQLLTDSLTPVISRVKLLFDKDLVESVVPNPQAMPYILKGDIVNFYIQFKGQLAEKTQVSLQYEDTKNNLPYSSSLEIDPESPSEPCVDKMGRFRKIRALQESQQSNSNLQDSMFCVKIIDKKTQIIEESVRYQVLSKYTAFLCVQKQLIDGKYEQVMSVGQENFFALQYEDLQECCEDQSGQNDFNEMYSPAIDTKCDLYLGCCEDQSGQNDFNEMYSPAIDTKCDLYLGQQILDFQAPQFELCNFDGIVDLGSPNQIKYQGYQTRKISQNIKVNDIQVAPLPLPLSSLPLLPPLPLNSQPQSFSDQLLGINHSPFNPPLPQLQKQIEFSDLFTKKQQHLQLAQNELNFPVQWLSIPHQSIGEPLGENASIKKEMKVEPQINLVDDVIQFEEKNQKIKNESVEVVDIKIVIQQQHFEGYWSNLELVKNLFSSDLEQKISNLSDKVVVITFLVMKWIEKYYPSKQYSLIRRKAENWLKKQSQYNQSITFYNQFLP